MIENVIEAGFREKTELFSGNSELQQILDGNISRLNDDINESQSFYSNLNVARRRAGNIRNKSIDNLERNLIDFEANFIRRNGKVIWAVDGKEAAAEVLNVLKKSYAKIVTKSRSVVMEEIEMTKPILGSGIEIKDTDYAEFCLSLSEEDGSSHPVYSAIHKSKEQLTALLKSKYEIDPNISTEDLVTFISQKIRPAFTVADVAISSANFLVSETGTVVIAENQGNVLLQTAFPKVHIVIATIDKVVSTLNDMDIMLTLYSAYSTGQKLSTYNLFLNGPRQEDEVDGPDEMYVVLIDNNRSVLLEKPEQRRALSCIKCGACHNVCPIYKTVGGQAYDTIYGGPIGSVTTPWLKDFESYKHLSFTTTLCGKCSTVCPVKIPIHKLLLYNRRDAIQLGLNTKKERFLVFAQKKIMTNRKLMNMGKSKFKNMIINKFFREECDLPNFSEKSFNKIYREIHAIK